MKQLFLCLVLSLKVLFANVYDKSAIVYYGKDISYTTVGIHDYIIVQPNHIDTATPGFMIYKKKMYAYVSIGEIDPSLAEYQDMNKTWEVTENKHWKSIVLDIKNKDYQHFLFTKMIEPQLKNGFENFFFDTLDSYQLYSKNDQERKANEKALADFINEFHKRYPKSKLVVNRGFEIIDQIHDSIDAVLFESYYKGTSSNKKNPYKNVSANDRQWFDVWLKKIRSYHKDIISVEYMPLKSIYSTKSDQIVSMLKLKGMIPYIANRDLSVYGKSSKVAIKREIFTLISEKRLDRTLQDSHQLGALILEYLGYKQKLYPIQKSLPSMADMKHYAGVMIWLRDYTKEPKKLIKWVKQLVKNKIKVVFMGNFGFTLIKGNEYKFLGIKVKKTHAQKIKILHKDPMVGYEIDPPMYSNNEEIHLKKGNPLLSYLYADDTHSSPIALASWGGYMVADGVTVNINGENLWVVNPFTFFKQALDLQTLPVADVTTQNGKRLLFTHIDGDGLANRVEGDFGFYSGDVIFNQILKKYKIPHSVSIIGSEIDKNGPFSKVREELIVLVKEMYKLDNVEGATHTFTHPFFWGKIQNDNLDSAYRLKVKDYQFSLKKELYDTLEVINKELYPKGKQPPARTVFWSGDCIPRENALKFLYRHHLLAINGGDTTITQINPWLSRIAPLGLERASYTQIYTGAQNENVFTNDWLGPFWGFKNVIQTFKMTNSPRRFKPVDVYYHLYSGSKQASLAALKDVFNWVMRQDLFPIYTSEYIPRVIEFYNYSIAKDKEHHWLFAGLDALNTIRIEEKDLNVDLVKSPTIIGIKHFENHTYLSLNPSDKQIVNIDSYQGKKEEAYMVSANAQLVNYKNQNNEKQFILDGYVPLKMSFFVPKTCKIQLSSQPFKTQISDNVYSYIYKVDKKVKVDIQCLKN